MVTTIKEEVYQQQIESEYAKATKRGDEQYRKHIFKGDPRIIENNDKELWKGN